MINAQTPYRDTSLLRMIYEKKKGQTTAAMVTIKIDDINAEILLNVDECEQLAMDLLECAAEIKGEYHG